MSFSLHVLLHGFLDPVYISSYASVYAVSSWFSTVDSPANDPRCVKRVIVLHDKTRAAVSLTRVLPSFRKSSTEHVLRQSAQITDRLSHLLNGGVTHLLIHDGKTDVTEVISGVVGLRHSKSRNPPEAETFTERRIIIRFRSLGKSHVELDVLKGSYPKSSS